MSQQLPPDQQAREVIEHDLISTLFVEAGAGTGKTTALVRRIVALVSSGVPVDRIAATTFTEKAAGEMKERVRHKLEERAVDEREDSEVRRRCHDAAQNLDSAAIETLHGFAQRILSLYPLEAGLPPRFEVVDDIQGQLAFEEHWSDLTDELLNAEDLQEPFAHCLRLGMTLQHLKELERVFHENFDRISPDALTSHPDLPEIFQPLTDEIRALVARLDQCADPADKLAEGITEQAVWLQMFESLPDDWKRLQALCDYKRPAINTGRQANWRTDLQEVKTKAKELQNTAETALEKARMRCAIPLVKRLIQSELDYAAERRRCGRLEFHDLLTLARDLLRAHPEIRRALHHRWECLLIDEYQDTDPLQIEIATLIAGDPDAPCEADWDWTKASAPDGRLLFVGDPRQSIYRFRRADVGLFYRTKESVGGRPVRLDANFRSHAGIIAWVNEMFSEIMIGEDSGGYTDLQVGRADASPGPGRVCVLGGPVDARAAEIRRREALDVVQTIIRAISEGWLVAEQSGDGSWTVRSPRLSDVAILLPARTSLPALEEALEDAGLPYRLESQSLIYSSVEVRECLNILRAVDDPSDQVCLVAALRSSAFGCTDRALWDFRSSGGRWGYLLEQPSQTAGSVVACALEALASYHQMRLSLTPGALLDLIVRERRMMELASVRRRPRESWRRLRFLIDRARVFTESTGGTLRQFLMWCDLQAESKTRVNETVAPETDDEAVRVMTIHAAKGLEFPIVALSGMSTEDRVPDSVQVLWDSSGRIGLKFGSASDGGCFRTEGMTELIKDERHLDRLEKDRLLYVAATRARDHLIVSLYHKQGSSGSSLASRLFSVRGDQREYRLPELDDDLALKLSAPPAPGPDTPEQRTQWFDERRRILATASVMPVRAATAVAREMTHSEALSPEDEEPQEEAAFRLAGSLRTGTATGRAVHAVLQSINLADPSSLPAAAAAQAWAEGLTSDEDIRRVRSLTAKALDSDCVRSALAEGSRFWREVFVSAMVEGVLLEGFIDLLYQTQDGLCHIVDYKTDTAAEIGAQELLRRYAPQGCSYALALEACLGQPVADVVFLFLSHTPALAVPVPNLDQGKQSVSSWLQNNRVPIFST